MYTFQLDKINRAFIIKISGTITMEEGEKFIGEYMQKIKTFDPTEYVLIIDGTDMRPCSAEVQKNLEFVIKLYMETPFADRIRIDLTYAAMTMQLKRLGGADVVQGFHLAKDLNAGLVMVPELLEMKKETV